MYVLHCEASGEPAGPVYRFRGARGPTRWPMDAGVNLGRAGCWNFALRIGGRPQEVSCEALPGLALDAPLFVALDGPLARERDRDLLRARLHGGGLVIGSGAPEAWSVILPEILAVTRTTSDNPYAAIAYRFGTAVDLIAPPRWPVHQLAAPGSDLRCSGDVVAVSGERQTPPRALMTPLPQCPAVARWRNLVYLNASPFHAFQAWLQGQEDLQPWMAWRHRLFWLDEWVASVRRVLAEAGIEWASLSGDPMPELGRTCVVLRHDLDYSRDTSYLDAEDRAGLPAVHSVLRDANTSFWLDELARHPGHECAFHYNTAHYSRAANWLRRRLGFTQRPYVPATAEIASHGLLKQVRWAKRRGVGVATLHRHLSFLQYPEWVDAVDEVHRQEPGVLGGSSLFRGQVLRWGVDRADGGRGTYADFPDAQFPYWMPFKLAHAADAGRLLRGWESASVMEIEPDLFQQMLHHRVPGLPQRVFTLNFHPAHAGRPTFVANGSRQHFIRLLEIIRESGVTVLTLEGVFAKLDRFVAEANVD